MSTTSSIQAVGIDVSSEELHVWQEEVEGRGKHKVFSNSSSGISKLIGELQRKSFKGRIVMESTGRYHGLCAVLMAEAGLQVSVINPLIAKKYQQAKIRKTKTDKTDAKLLAEVAIKEKNLPLWTHTKADLRMRQRVSTLKSLEKSLQRFSATLRDMKDVAEKTELALTEEEEKLEIILKDLRRQKERLEKEFVLKISTDQKHEKSYGLIRTVPGISPFMAALILFFYSHIEGEKSKQWVAFTGLDISIFESGKWKGHGRLAKRGNRYLRKRWFSCAWGAMMHDEASRKYYQDLKDNGRKHREALNILARKLIRTAHAILKTQQPYCPASSCS
jgi:transposase